MRTQHGAARSVLALVLLVAPTSAACTKSTDAAIVTPVCETDSNDCQEDTLRRCNDVGSGWDIVKRCPPGTCITGEAECGGPVAPLASDAWVACTPGSGGDITTGDPPCKPVGSGAKIDPFEVTRSQYLAFWRATVNGRNTLGLTADCDFKKTVDFSPTVNGWPTLTEAEARLPMTEVDQCDARGYCRWAGKRLCAGADGKPYREPFETRGAATRDEWEKACEAGVDSTPCNVKASKDAPEKPIAAVGSSPGCVTSEGVYDLHGNVAELVDVCTDKFGLCRALGGAAGDYGLAVDCTSNIYNYIPINRRSSDVGFRCCTD